MRTTVEIEGLNLEKLLGAAAEAGIVLVQVRRCGVRTLRLQVYTHALGALAALCERYGWTYRPVRVGLLMACAGFFRRRIMLLPALLAGIFLVWLSSNLVLCVRIEHAGAHEALVRSFLQEKGVRPLRPKATLNFDALEAEMAYALPGLVFSGLRCEGSTLICDCRPAVQGEDLTIRGDSHDIVAAQSGIVQKIWVQSGTPQVVPGQVVSKGQVLISGYEKTEKGGLRPVKAQGQVIARVYVRGEARAGLQVRRVVQTGRERTRITVKTPWHARVVRDAQPFASQQADRRRQHVSTLYLPLWRDVETMTETESFAETREQSEAASIAQGAAEGIAKEQCPADALIIDKWVNYSMIDNEFVYASVVLAYETSIAGRIQ